MKFVSICVIIVLATREIKTVESLKKDRTVENPNSGFAATWQSGYSTDVKEFRFRNPRLWNLEYSLRNPES